MPFERSLWDRCPVPGVNVRSGRPGAVFTPGVQRFQFTPVSDIMLWVDLMFDFTVAEENTRR